MSFKTGQNDSTLRTIDKGFYVSETEITYLEWFLVYTWATNNGYSFANVGQEGNDGVGGAVPTSASNEPVTFINWRDCMVWCNAITEYYTSINPGDLSCVYFTDNTFATPIRVVNNSTNIIFPDPGGQDDPYVNESGTGFRLLGTWEWELAARYYEDSNLDGVLFTSSEYYPGDYASGATDSFTNITACSVVAVFGTTLTSNVKSKQANALGIYDMSGNVWEWCWDWIGCCDSTRAVRGGAYHSTASSLGVGYEVTGAPDYEDNSIGFRIARSQ